MSMLDFWKAASTLTLNNQLYDDKDWLNILDIVFFFPTNFNNVHYLNMYYYHA